ncbi:MAG: phytanoyl-CoA dioxygenase [Gemmatimonadota bacterium]
MPTVEPSLTREEIQRFMSDGFVVLRSAFDPDLAARGRAILWADMGLNPDRPAEWREPAIRLIPSDETPFREAVNTPVLLAAFDQLVGKGRWYRRPNAGAFVVRFPVDASPDDVGWHVEGSFAVDGTHHTNLVSRERGLLLLMLFSDVDTRDGPTKIRVGSHLDVPAVLRNAGDVGLRFHELAPAAAEASAHRDVTFATGRAGDVYLCHPFIVHSAQAHSGTAPRFMSQPGLTIREPLALERPDGDYSPVEQAVRAGLEPTVAA